MSPSTTRAMHSLQQHLRQYLAHLGHCMADALSTVPGPLTQRLGDLKKGCFPLHHFGGVHGPAGGVPCMLGCARTHTCIAAASAIPVHWNYPS